MKMKQSLVTNLNGDENRTMIKSKIPKLKCQSFHQRKEITPRCGSSGKTRKGWIYDHEVRIMRCSSVN
ncbi:hypothetical protein Bpfe_006818 [Biomphalaria pfeifferi]|uniref:Uncharacterized protein n=1 Tax=Biomphalaria pfeifferi TaxID=112525 RepID=A0AAD8C0V3_BIOPF|nr:hypothetical protein Bpfe_006818 [Biomphalaria pfeifferi]